MVCGMWRIVHENPSYKGMLAFYNFENGRSTRPAFGKELSTLVAVFGREIYLEPWTGDVPSGVPMPEVCSPPTPEQIARLDKAPSAAVEETPVVHTHGDPGSTPGAATKDVLDEVADADSLDGLERSQLRRLALRLGLRPHWNLGTDKLRAIIRDAQADIPDRP